MLKTKIKNRAASKGSGRWKGSRNFKNRGFSGLHWKGYLKGEVGCLPAGSIFQTKGKAWAKALWQACLRNSKGAHAAGGEWETRLSKRVGAQRRKDPGKEKGLLVHWKRTWAFTWSKSRPLARLWAEEWLSSTPSQCYSSSTEKNYKQKLFVLIQGHIQV